MVRSGRTELEKKTPSVPLLFKTRLLAVFGLASPFPQCACSGGHHRRYVHDGQDNLVRCKAHKKCFKKMKIPLHFLVGGEKLDSTNVHSTGIK